jgi:hypothetical protein
MARAFNNFYDRQYAFNEPIKFCHISPTKYLNEFTETNGAHLLLAHLVEQDSSYADYYANLDDGKYKILDNSAFEMFKQGRPMYDSNKLLDMGRRCKADCIVMSDYPKESSEKTINAAKELIPQFKDAGFQTFFVPQSTQGNTAEYLDCFRWALDNEEIDVIGVSILACPLALDVNETSYYEGPRSDSYKMQRYLSRWQIMRMLSENDDLNDRAIKRLHFLGMTDGPKEILLMRDYGYDQFIHTWDSSAAIWTGLHNIMFDNSPTGLKNGKFEKEVDFNYQEGYHFKSMVEHNINYINQLLK